MTKVVKNTIRKIIAGGRGDPFAFSASTDTPYGTLKMEFVIWADRSNVDFSIRTREPYPEALHDSVVKLIDTFNQEPAPPVVIRPGRILTVGACLEARPLLATPHAMLEQLFEVNCTAALLRTFPRIDQMMLGRPVDDVITEFYANPPTAMEPLIRYRPFGLLPGD